MEVVKQVANNLIATSAALQLCLERATDSWFSTFSCPTDGSWGVMSIDLDDATYLVARDEPDGSARAVILSQNERLLTPAPAEGLREMIQRVHRVLMEAAEQPVQLPYAWSEFRHDNLIAFFACRREYGALRWIAELNVGGSQDVGFWVLTGPGRERTLAEFSESADRDRALGRYRGVVGRWTAAWLEARRRFSDLPAPEPTELIQPSIDLDVTTFGAVTQHRTSSAWLPHLTPKQLEFVKAPAESSIKLRGPAGSGKTLALALKALRQLYLARENGQPIRILFATHSWAVAEQTDKVLQGLDEGGSFAEIEVYPLLAIARDRLPATTAADSLAVLGEDSLSGKQLQLELIDDVLERLRRGDWLAYRGQCSTNFAKRVESARGSRERNSLVWDLMMEFSSVLAAQGILPGVNAERQYLRLQRTAWMMPLESEADKRFVLRVYSEYIGGLREQKMLTSDQLIRDFLNYLETFTWDVKREKQGYDLIFVDELHLFTEQERLVFHYLTRSAEKYPRLFMALDPRQAPYEVYAKFADVEVTQGESGQVDERLGTVGQVDLQVVHRFTPEILELVRHIHWSYPAIELGHDWEFDAEGIRSARPSGDKPRLFQHANRDSEIRNVLDRAGEVIGACPREERVAIILLDPLGLEEFDKASAETGRGLRLSVIQSRDDVETLQYARRSVVLSAAEYVAGLQFSHVIVAGLPAREPGHPYLGHQLRRFLSSFYLAVSRATAVVEIHTNEEAGDLPQVLESALTNGIIVRGE